MFAGWFVGSTISPASYPALLLTGLVSLFGSTTLAIPFLLETQQLPADLFNLYITVDVVGVRFGMMLAGMQYATLALLTAFAMGGRLKIQWPRLVPFVATVVLSTTAIFVGLGLFFAHGLKSDYLGYQAFVSLELLDEPVPTTLVDHPDQSVATIGRRSRESRNAAASGCATAGTPCRSPSSTPRKTWWATTSTLPTV